MEKKIVNKPPPVIGYVYMFTFPNSKRYIGQTVQKYTLRWSTHNSHANHPDHIYDKHGCRLLYPAIRKYKWKNIVKEIIIICDPSKLTYYENKAIKTYLTLVDDGFGYNLILEEGDRRIPSINTRILQSGSHLGQTNPLGRIRKGETDLSNLGGIRYKTGRSVKAEAKNVGFVMDNHPLAKSIYFSFADCGSEGIAIKYANQIMGCLKAAVLDMRIGKTVIVFSRLYPCCVGPTFYRKYVQKQDKSQCDLAFRALRSLEIFLREEYGKTLKRKDTYRKLTCWHPFYHALTVPLRGKVHKLVKKSKCILL